MKTSSSKILIVFIFLFIAYTGSSQVSFGVKSGINIATTKGIIEFPKNRIGPYFGGFASISIDQKCLIQGELLYSSKGYKYVDLSDNQKVAMRLNYLSFPILFGYKIDYKTKIMAGLELDYLMKATNYFNQHNINATTSFPKRFDLGLDVGVSYNIVDRFGMEVRYNYGFNHLYQIDNAGVRRSDDNGANRAFQIGIYFRIENNIKKK